MQSVKAQKRTRAQYLAELKQAKAERLISAVQEAARTGQVRPFKALCWAIRSQENRRVRRATQRRMNHRRTAAMNDDALIWRNPLDLSPGYGITALHVACQLFARSVTNNDSPAVAALEEVVAILMRPSRPVTTKNEKGVAVSTMVRPGATPTLLMRDPSRGDVSCVELCPRKPGRADRIVPKALADYFIKATDSDTSTVTHVVRIERHSGVMRAMKERKERVGRVERTVPAELRDLGAPTFSVWTKSSVSGRAMEPSFTR